MWCIRCQQDVRGLESDSGQYCCPRCAAPLGGGQTPGEAEAVPCAVADELSPSIKAFAALALPPALPPVVDDWQTDDDLLHMQRVLGPMTLAAKPRPAAPVQVESSPPEPTPSIQPSPECAPTTETVAVPPQADEPLTDLVQPTEPALTSEQQPDPEFPQIAWTPALGRLGQKVEACCSRWILPAVEWIAAMSGVTAVACGGVLLLWSKLTARAELGEVGKPIVVGGAIFLFVGLLLRVDRARRQAACPAIEEPACEDLNPAGQSPSEEGEVCTAGQAA